MIFNLTPQHEHCKNRHKFSFLSELWLGRGQVCSTRIHWVHNGSVNIAYQSRLSMVRFLSW